MVAKGPAVAGNFDDRALGLDAGETAPCHGDVDVIEGIQGNRV